MALTGQEILQVTGVTGSGLPSGQSLQTTTQAIAALSGTVGNTQVATPLNTVGNGTITAAGIIGRVTTRGGAQASAPFTDTTDTANAITAALPAGAPVGTALRYLYSNTTNAVATISGGSGVTVSVITSIPPNSFGEWLVTYASTSTYTFVGVAQGFYPHSGTFTVTGTAAVTVSDTNVTTASSIDITLKNVGGTVGAIPAITTITTGTGFTVKATTGDVSIYNYTING
jgi:hypothetical protein